MKAPRPSPFRQWRDPDVIIAALWGHYKQETPGWMDQAALLPSW